MLEARSSCDRARVAQKEGGADLVFERLDLPADRALRERKFFGGRAEVEVAGHGFEGAQMPGGNGAGAGVAAGELHGGSGH
jgi:hypothetical protein